MAAAIEIRGITKRYRLASPRQSQNSLREVIAGRVRDALHPRRRTNETELCALDGIDIDVEEGASLGVIGRNGAGKSTLLKILARITEPTSGRARLRGRVGALLEVGTGFHGELTGRENVFLNGAVLGMRRGEVRRRFAEIVEFAGVERFIDTPVKRYSSGMSLRLAFAVAAHLDTEILLVDEVLAVGDIEFQRRCLKRMGELERAGRTILFVSHDLEAVGALCDRVIWLDRGRAREIGAPSSVVASYVEAATSTSAARPLPRIADPRVDLTAIRVNDAPGQWEGDVARREPVTIEVDFEVCERVPSLDLTLFVQTAAGVRLLEEAWSEAVPAGRGATGAYRARLTLPPLFVAGDYTVGIWIGSPYETLLHEDAAAGFRLHGGHGGRPRRLLSLPASMEVRIVDSDR